jgi:hypothetical protein
MTTVLGIIAILFTLAIVLGTIGLFVWAAIKDGEEDKAIRSRVVRRRWPGDERSS